MLMAYLNQTAILTPALRNEDGSPQTTNRGQIAYGEAREIVCRKRVRTQEFITPAGQTIKVNWQYHCVKAILTDDLLDSRRVQDVREMVNLEGAIIGYRAVT